MSSTTLIANLIEEEALLGSVSVVSSLTHGNVALAEVMVPRMRHFSNEDGVLINEVLLPDNAIIAAVASGGTWKWPTTRRCCIREIKAIVVADEDVLDDVRLAFRGSSGCGKGRLHVAWAESGGTLIRGCESAGEELRVFQFAQTVLVRLPRRNQGTLIRSDSPRSAKQPTGLFRSLRNSLGQGTPCFLLALTLLIVLLVVLCAPATALATDYRCSEVDLLASVETTGRCTLTDQRIFDLTEGGERAGAVEVALRWVHRRAEVTIERVRMAPGGWRWCACRGVDGASRDDVPLPWRGGGGPEARRLGLRQVPAYALRFRGCHARARHVRGGLPRGRRHQAFDDGRLPMALCSPGLRCGFGRCSGKWCCL